MICSMRKEISIRTVRTRLLGEIREFACDKSAFSTCRVRGFSVTRETIERPLRRRQFCLGKRKNEATASQLSVSKSGHFNRTQLSLHSLSARFPGP